MGLNPYGSQEMGLDLPHPPNRSPTRGATPLRQGVAVRGRKVKNLLPLGVFGGSGNGQGLTLPRSTPSCRLRLRRFLRRNLRHAKSELPWTDTGFFQPSETPPPSDRVWDRSCCSAAAGGHQDLHLQNSDLPHPPNRSPTMRVGHPRRRLYDPRPGVFPHSIEGHRQKGSIILQLLCLAGLLMAAATTLAADPVEQGFPFEVAAPRANWEWDQRYTTGTTPQPAGVPLFWRTSHERRKSTHKRDCRAVFGR
jgi:hypothetical protein